MNIKILKLQIFNYYVQTNGFPNRNNNSPLEAEYEWKQMTVEMRLFTYFFSKKPFSNHFFLLFRQMCH
jgi:hypothetical protein